MTPYNTHRITRELKGLTDAPHTTGLGDNLHHLAVYLLGEIPGVTVIGQKVFDHARPEEKDLWITHTGTCGLPFVDLAVPVECKNENAPTSPSEIRDFAAKIRNSGGHDGLLITRTGLAGHPHTSAHHAIGLELTHGIRINVITTTDIAMLTCTDDLTRLLQDRHIELRVLQTYRSI